MQIILGTTKCMHNRPKQNRHKFKNSNWSTDQDCLLIEYSHLPIDTLLTMLSFEYDDRVLCLIRREKKKKKLHDT